MTKVIKFPENIFSEKELTDFKRREQVVGLLRGGETWKNIRTKTGAHLQTIAILAKRLKFKKSIINNRKQNGQRPILEFGVHSQNDRL